MANQNDDEKEEAEEKRQRNVETFLPHEGRKSFANVFSFPKVFANIRQKNM